MIIFTQWNDIKYNLIIWNNSEITTETELNITANLSGLLSGYIVYIFTSIDVINVEYFV